MTSEQLKSEKIRDIKKILGKDSFGKVSMIKKKENKKVFALKEIGFSGIQYDIKSKMMPEEAENEFKLLSKHLKNVVPAYGKIYNQDEKNLLFSMELCDKSLQQFVEERSENLKFTEFLPLFENIVTGS